MNPTKTDLAINVATFRGAGLEAKWSKNRNGRPIIVLRDPKACTAHQREIWWTLSADMFAAMRSVGIREAFNRCTILGDMFSVAA